jgi:hypothetical protein
MMTRNEGHRLLNRLQEGTAFDQEQITAALIATGDLDRSLAAGMRSQGMDQAVHGTPQTAGQQVRPTVVGSDQGTDTQGAWPGWSRYLDR